MTRFTVQELADRLHGEVQGDPAIEVRGFAPAETAREGDLTFAESNRYVAQAEASAASAVIVDLETQVPGKTLIRVRNARLAFAQVLELFFPEPAPVPGIHPTAIVPASASVDPSAHIGPYCVLEGGVRIGARSALLAHVHVGKGCAIGEDCRLFPNVTLYRQTRLGNRVRIHAGAVIGADGYGYVLEEGRHRKIPQVGQVVIEDDVEIGANVTVDRGAVGPTVLGRGTKIDNLVQIGHNAVVGQHCLLISQVGIAGSTKLGNYVTLAGQVGIAGHLKIGHRAVIAAKSGVMNDIPDQETWMGIPATRIQDHKRQVVAIHHLPEMARRLRELERRLAQLEGRALREVGTPDPDGP